MCSRPCVATISASGGPFGFEMLPFGSDSWNGGTDELKAATIRTMKIAKPISASTASRPLRPETRLLRRCARAGRLLAGGVAIAATVAEPLAPFKRGAGLVRPTPSVRWAVMPPQPQGGKILIPRWIQLVGLPLVLLFVWVVAGAVKHVLFLFIVAMLIALFFDPIVRAFHIKWVPRGFAVAIVYIVTTLVVIAALAVAGTVVVTQSKRAAN